MIYSFSLVDKIICKRRYRFREHYPFGDAFSWGVYRLKPIYGNTLHIQVFIAMIISR